MLSSVVLDILTRKIRQKNKTICKINRQITKYCRVQDQHISQLCFYKPAVSIIQGKLRRQFYKESERKYLEINFSNKTYTLSVWFGSTYTKIGIIQRLAWSLLKDGMQIHKAVHIFKCLTSQKKRH